MSRPEHALDAAAARDLAEQAGSALMAVRAGFRGDDLRDLKALGDRSSHELLVREIERRFPGDAILSEEGADDPARLAAQRVWIVDPLDGTREFGELDRDDWAVHVALWVSGELVAGAVALPARGLTYWSGEVHGIPGRPDGPIRLAVSRSRPPAFVQELADRIGAVLVPMGSAGVKAMAVVDGTVDAYVHAGGQFEWDSAAPVAVAAAHGLQTTRLDGSPLRYNEERPYLPDLVVSRPDILPPLRDAINQLV